MTGGVTVGRDGAVSTGGRAERCEAAGLRVSWVGFAFVPGQPAGRPSIARFAERAAREGVAPAADALRGQYFAAVETGAETLAFVDPSGYFHAFHSPDGAADDFLALARTRGADLDPEAVAELVTQGQVAFGRTPFAAIARIGAEQLVRLGGEGPPRVGRRPVAPLERPPDAGLMAQLERLLPTLAGRSLSLDLTGGLDSRLLAVALARLGVPFETVTTGGPGSREIELARRVAAALDRPHHAVVHRPETLSADLDDLLLGTGCLVNPLASHRELQLQRSRRERDVDLVLNGLGGESFKDFFWQQDFPRYWGSHADLQRLWRLRIERPQARTAPLAGEYAIAARGMADAYVRRLEAYRMPRRTQTYDSIFFNVRSRDVNGRGLTLRNRVLATYAPLVDRDLQRLAFCLPRRARVFNAFHRRTLTRLAPDVARLPTTDGGMSASSEPTALPADAVRWVATRAWRLALRAAPARMRPLPADSPLPPLLRLVRTLPTLERSVERLRGAGVLRPGTTAADLADGHVGGVLALARLLEELERSGA